MEELNEWVSRVFKSGSFMPHGHCYMWERNLVWLHVISDAIIFCSYVSIPITLVYFIWKRKDLPFSWMFGLFGVFIIACGTTHLMEIWTLWKPHYWLSGLVKAVTAIASIGTAMRLVLLVPQALAIPSPALLRETNQKLQESLVEKDKLIEKVEQTQKKLIEVSRKAGMADIATNLLHNVGNALNSINVATDQIRTLTKESKIEGLRKAMDLVRSQPNREEFLLRDPKGQKIFDYLLSVTESLEASREQVLEELETLAKGVDHVKIIVSLQQEHAKSTGVIEKVFINDVVEDALRLNTASYDQYDVKVQKDFNLIPEVQIDRHKFLQIMMNLLSNARHAVKDCDHTRSILIRTGVLKSDRVFVEIRDNGIGIPKENLEKIFNHGFSTKPGGHGFGLHSGACLAMEMGGQLIAESKGPDQGATFILTLPLSLNPSSS